MKKTALLLLLLASVIAINNKSFAKTRSAVVTTASDTTRKKIVHPKEAMTDVQVNDILNAMRQKRDDKEKVAQLKVSVKDKGITVEQLMTLLNQFLTDDSKIEAAEYAFPYTTNYKAFLKIMDLFSQEGYKNMLEDFYGKNRK
jgi:hypothetical protein